MITEEVETNFPKFNIESLNSYVSEFNNDIDVNLTNIREKSMLVSSIRSKWLMYFFKEKENLDKIKTKKHEILEKRLTDVIPNQTDSILKIRNEEKLANDKTIKVLTKLENNTKACLDYIEYAMNILNDFNFQIKNSIDILKLEKL